jgi:hypothetical protein
MTGHANTQDLEQYISGQLSEDDAWVVHMHLAECEDCQLRLADIAIEIQWTGAERRGEPRVPVSFPGRLKLLDPVTSIGPPHDVYVVEISRSGFKVQTPRRLIPKTLVQVRFNGKTLLGEVRYCVPKDDGYHAGIKRALD